MISETPPIRSLSIEHLVQQRTVVLERLANARHELDLALAAGRSAGIPRVSDAVSRHARHEIDLLREDWQERARSVIDAQCWDRLMNESGLLSLMDATARQDWHEKINRLETPVLNMENVTATFEALHDARGDMFERGIIAIFRSLSWCYATNSPVKFGKRIILTGLVRDYAYGYFEYGTCNRLDDLLRVCHLLDGKPEPDHRTGAAYQLQEAHQARQGKQWVGPYLAIKWFRNGNGHLTFLRPDLVDEMNRILAKHHPNALPAAR